MENHYMQIYKYDNYVKQACLHSTLEFSVKSLKVISKNMLCCVL